MIVEVGGHRVAYDGGRLVALDHGDVEAEQALAVLAGEPACGCIELVVAWDEAVRDPCTPLVAPRNAQDTVHLDPGELRALEEQVAAWRRRMRAARQDAPGGAHLDPAVAAFENGLLARLRWLRLWTLPAGLQLALREQAVGPGR